jgi:hypothetical protein
VRAEEPDEVAVRPQRAQAQVGELRAHAGVKRISGRLQRGGVFVRLRAIPAEAGELQQGREDGQQGCRAGGTPQDNQER